MEHIAQVRKITNELLSEVFNVFCQSYDVTIDSRKVKQGTIFVALKGEHTDGNIFAKIALESGASLVVIDNKDYYINDKTLLVEDSLIFLQKFARYYRDTFTIPFIGISGTNGKTTTKELMYEVLSSTYKVGATAGNLNNQIGVPLTLLSLKKDCQIAIIEMGASHIGDIDELCRIANPNIAILTNIGTAHIEGFGSFEGVIKTKTELFRYIEQNNGKAFVNIDDENLLSNKPENSVTYSLKTFAATQGNIINADKTFASIEVCGEKICSHLVGTYNCYNILAAVTVGLSFGVDITKIKHAIESYIPTNNRSQVKKTDKNTLILDCYNANPSSCRFALEAFDKIGGYKDKRVFIGSMKELGKVSQSEHEAISRIIKNMNLTQAVFVGEEYKGFADKENCLWFATSSKAKEFLQKQNTTNALILIKGSRATQMEILQDAL